MSTTTKNGRSNDPALIVFGMPKGARAPHAAWFSGTYANRAKVAADQHGLSTLTVGSQVTRAVAATLKEGQLKAGGQLVTPCVTEGMLHQLRSVIPQPLPGSTLAANNSGVARVQVPATVWDALKPNDLVLAADLDKSGVPDGWYEAVIVQVDDGSFTLRWVDYGHEGLVRRQRRHIALMYTD